jgi:hypothetical protein
MLLTEASMQPDKEDMHSRWQVIIQTSENISVFEWDLDRRNQQKIGRIFHRLKQNDKIGTIIPQSDKYLNCVILDTEGNQLHCGNEFAVYKKGNLIELRQDIGRQLENEILKTMPPGLEQELLAVINYIENTTQL